MHDVRAHFSRMFRFKHPTHVSMCVEFFDIFIYNQIHCCFDTMKMLNLLF